MFYWLQSITSPSTNLYNGISWKHWLQFNGDSINSENKLNFIIQEKQVDLLPKMRQNVSTPEGVPRLFDLVKVRDERMKLAFFAALRNTVVAKDLDQVWCSIHACLTVSLLVYVKVQMAMFHLLVVIGSVLPEFFAW